jgi:thioredoxin-related protein
MNKLSTALMLAFILAIANTHAQGVEFIKDKWSNVLAKASQEDKLIFVDAYTTWCGPCKMMDRNVFTTRKVGDFFNENFINVKIDMESGEGPALARQFSVRAYPTFLFINASGEVVHRGLGYHEPDDFLALAKEALDSDNNLFALKQRYDNGDRDPDFLYQYSLQLYDAMDESYPLIAEEYLKTQKDWNLKKNLDLIYKTSDASGSAMFKYFLKNKALFEEEFGSRAVNGKIQYFVQNEIYNSQKSGDQTRLKQLLEILHPGRAEEMLARMQLSYLAQNEKYDEYANAAIDFYGKYKAENWDELNEVAWLFYETVDNPSHLKQAVKWAKQSIKMDPNYYNHDTLALLYHKLGKDKKALKFGKKAIAMAHKSGEDCSSTENWLREIAKGK